VHDETREISATDYMMSEEAFIAETEFVFGQHQNRQAAIAEIEERAGLSFGPLADIDPFDQVEEAVPTLPTDPSQIRSCGSDHGTGSCLNSVAYQLANCPRRSRINVRKRVALEVL